jgi:hypothetical protein
MENWPWQELVKVSKRYECSYFQGYLLDKSQKNGSTTLIFSSFRVVLVMALTRVIQTLHLQVARLAYNDCQPV